MSVFALRMAFREINDSYHADDAFPFGAFGKFAGVEKVAGFADAVLRPYSLVVFVIPSRRQRRRVDLALHSSNKSRKQECKIDSKHHGLERWLTDYRSPSHLSVKAIPQHWTIPRPLARCPQVQTLPSRQAKDAKAW